MRAPSIAIALLLGAAPLAPLSAEEPAPPAAKGPEVARASSPGVAWQLGVDHRYVWFRDAEKVGETLFRIVESRPEPEGGGASPGQPAGLSRFVLTATRSYDRDGISQRGREKTTFLADGTPLAFEEDLDISAINKLRSAQATSIRFEGGKAHLKYIANGREDQSAQHQIEVPPGSFLYANQAVEHWAVFVSCFPAGASKHDVKLFYPDNSKVLEVTFRSAGTEKIKVGSEEVEANRYRFQSSANEMTGSIWIDAERRLLQVEFPNPVKDLALRVVLDRRPAY